MITLHILAPKLRKECVVIDCPTCDRQRKAYGFCAEWYGWDITCAGCGDRWQDGELCPRPFARGWRQQNIRHAREQLAKIGVQA